MVLTLILIAHSLPADQEKQPLKIDKTIDWGGGNIILDITAELPDTGQALPAGRYLTEQEILKNLPVVTREQLMPLSIDSWHTISSYMKEVNPEIFRPLEELYQQLERRYSKATPDLKEITMRFQLRLYPDVVNLFIKHTTPQTIPRLLEYEPTKEFSGIVIYAKELLPLHGTPEEAGLQPCLFPRIYDEEMNLVFESEMVAPRTLQRWGMVAYTKESNDNSFQNRIGRQGLEPLRIMARGVFGRNHTDLIIPNSAARKILALEENRQLLREGRVLIIY